MSYLGTPRLHFCGTFLADPSTVNNTPDNYQESNYQAITEANAAYHQGLEAAGQDPEKLRALQEKYNSPYLSWNPFGTGNFEIQTATIHSFVDDTGTCYDSSNSDDPLIGATLKTVGGPSGAPGKLVDLDTDLQVHTRLFGLYLNLVFKGQNDSAMAGYFDDTCRLLNLWFGRINPNRNPDNGAGGAWQSVIKDAEWRTDAIASSPFLQALHAAAVAASGLSIRISVFGYQNTLGDESFSLGTVVGSIGPQGAHEPANFLAGRFLIPQTKNGNLTSQMWFAAAETDIARKTLTVDLGNSIPVKAPASPTDQVPYDPLELGKMEAVLRLPNQDPVCLGEIDYAPDAFFQTAGVTQLDLSHLSSQELAQLNEHPIGIQVTESGKHPVLQLAEADDGIYIDVDPATHYMEPNDSKNIQVYARCFGQPVSQEVDLALREAGSIDKDAPFPASFALPPGTNEPVWAVSFPNSVTTDKNTGNATFSVVAAPLSSSQVATRRQAIRSQLYFISGSWMPENDWFAPAILKVFFAPEAITNPTWQDVHLILRQYFVLYPVMFYRININLDDYDSVKQNAEPIRHTLMLPLSDGVHMPATRDLSRDDRATVLRWINNGCPQ